ncbi:MAG: response regulator [Candidatus Magnetomorum sp.]|nr:response regulator [Candidatus Magnetomorum sp.]
MIPTHSEQQTILLVDDQPENLQPIVYYLENFNYKIHISMTGEGALEILQHSIPDIILLDVLMPGIDGLETCRRIKAKPEWADIPVLFMTAVTDTSNKVKAFEAGCQDYITKPIQYEELLARVKTHIKIRHMQKEILKYEKLQSLGVLAGGIAHDFNNILSIILGNIQLLKEEARHSSLIKSTEKAVMRAANLSKSLITFSKGGTPFKQKGNIVAVLKESMKFILDTSQSTFELNISDDLAEVNFDEQQIRQVFNQIILNADQAMLNNGKIYINIDNYSVEGKESFFLKKGKYIHISISDSGYGISHDDLKRIFDPYFSTQERGSQKGMGLGLAIAHSIVTQHKGSIDVESTPNKGSTFHIYLPATKTEKKEAPVQKARPSRKKPIHPSTQKRVLIMDDEEGICTLVKTILEREGYVVDEAIDGESAIQMYSDQYYKKSPYAAVILDLTVKRGMGGKDAMKHILSIDPDVNAIISSGYSSDPVMANYKDYEFKDVLIKPYHVHELQEALNRVIGGTSL